MKEEVAENRMKNSRVRIIGNREIAPDMYEMILKVGGEDAGTLRDILPGQFINIRLDGFYLRRPISISEWDEENDTMTIIYKVVGRGTLSMSGMEPGQVLDILWPLGNGFDISHVSDVSAVTVEETAAGIIERRPLLIGGGAGVPPMVGLCRSLISEGIRPDVVLGFRRVDDVICAERMEAMGARVIITTEDGSRGTRGFVTDAIEELTAECSYFFACGPEPMLRNLCTAMPEEIQGQLSFEERMGCGFGACMGCSCRTRYGSKRICREGPVLKREEVIW